VSNRQCALEGRVFCSSEETPANSEFYCQTPAGKFFGDQILQSKPSRRKPESIDFMDDNVRRLIEVARIEAAYAMADLLAVDHASAFHHVKGVILRLDEALGESGLDDILTICERRGNETGT
jgi:hypothetical protein